MKPIKFRVWDKQLQIWACYEYVEDGTWWTQPIGSVEQLSRFKGTNFAVGKQFQRVEYTGLKDSTGIEIYEGDIVCVPISGRIGMIMFGEYKAIFNKNYGWYIKFKEYQVPITPEFSEVIGNMQETPELWKNCS